MGDVPSRLMTGVVYGVKMSWKQFTDFEDWLESDGDDPPLTAEVDFMYKDVEYHIDGSRGDYYVSEWISNINDQIICKRDNFLVLLTEPLFDGKSFKDCIEEFLFAY